MCVRRGCDQAAAMGIEAPGVADATVGPPSLVLHPQPKARDALDVFAFQAGIDEGGPGNFFNEG